MYAQQPQLVAYGTILPLELIATANNQTSTALPTIRQTAHSECVQILLQLNTADGPNKLEPNQVALAHKHQLNASHSPIQILARPRFAQEPTNTANGSKSLELLTATADQQLELELPPVTLHKTASSGHLKIDAKPKFAQIN